MTKIKKLSNVQYTVTDEVLLRKWTEVISKRNKLLSMSDWTQLSDCNLPANIQRLWLKWREKIRNIKKTTVVDPDKALSLLLNLEKQMPEKLSENIPNVDTPSESKNIISVNDTDEVKEYIDNLIKTAVLPKIISLDEITNIINQKSNNNLHVVLENVEKKIKELTPVLTLSKDIEEAKVELNSILNENVYKRYPQFNEELFQEAIDYSSGSYNGDLPLLQLYATHYKKSLKDMADHMLQEKRQWIKTICDIEKWRLNFLYKIDDAVTIEELNNILKQLN